MHHLPEISIHFWQKNFLCCCCASYKENWEKSKEMIMKTIHCKGIHFWKLYLRCQLGYAAYFLYYFRDIIQCNCLFHLFKCSLGGSSLNFHEFLILPIRKISRNTKKEIHSWGELPMKWNCKYETCKTKNLQRWNVILTNENDAILWVTAITTVPEIKKHIKVGLQFVINEGIK